jgi:hypothetical protein
VDRSPITEQSQEGTYLVIAQSRSLSAVIIDPDPAPRIIRYRSGGDSNLLDGQPMSGVSGSIDDLAPRQWQTLIRIVDEIDEQGASHG